MQLPLFQVDAFAERVFAGNPAAVVPLEGPLDPALMQAVAAENNLSETAFFHPEGDGFRLCWFTPVAEVDLCGHATLASAWTLFERLGWARPEIAFETRSGRLVVRREADGSLAMDFPSRPPREVPWDEALAAAAGGRPRAMLAARDAMLVYDSEEEVRALAPDMAALVRAAHYALIVTAPGTGGVDFVSRFFAPKQGIPEDPVTGSAHCTLVPYWAVRLGRAELEARQISRRGGALRCRDRGTRIEIGGRCKLYMEGQIHV
ncbi:MAG: PhzF family phenazine biosynthesis protein [Alphaproteobacteria bacterium]|nr:PhzF family phenazine biosynthesis protein [Alphaproteobacteria bacterium]